ncbi:transposase [Marinilactibacillus kalidii]|uniref:transposase n=1 Tax=Marinilactibacillus kalidii TaxID=2820274 RepID=UPI001ABE03E2|nr:transposase [Marinilactibacillus kalidii]
MKYIAEEHTVLPTTVKRFISHFVQTYYPVYQALPSCLLFDEFKTVKNVKGSMSFIYADGDTHEVIDVNAAYEFFIRELFPNAKIIIDRFHILQLIFE